MTGIYLGSYRFAPRLVPSLAAILFCVLTVALGNWQTRRAEEKTVLQQRLDAYTVLPPLELGQLRVKPSEWVDHRVSVRGRFSPEQTVFIDNRVREGIPGYYVVTPLRITGGDMHVLVNRGWIAAGSRREHLPTVNTPEGTVAIEGIAAVPLAHPYELAPDAKSGPLRQNLVPERMEAETGLAMQPVVVLQTSPASDGLMHEWPKPDAGVDMHRAYALQWYVMAALAAVSWIVLNLRRTVET